MNTATTVRPLQPILLPGGIYDFGPDYGLVEFIGCSGKKKDEANGVRFWSFNQRLMVTLKWEDFVAIRNKLAQ